MTREPFAAGDSPIHRTSPALRLTLATIFSFTVAVMHDIAALAAALAAGTALALVIRGPVKPLANRLIATFGVLIMVWLIVPVTYGGVAAVQIGPIGISQTGARLCLQITLKTLSILLVFISLVATMDTATLGHTLNRLGLPRKLVMLLLLAYRYIFVIEQEYQRLYRAARIRNFTPGTNLHTYRTYAYLVGMLFVRASERAVRVHHAMKCRGFNGRFHTLSEFRPTGWNPGLAFGVSMAMLLILGLEFHG
jgi:cobalt/nickel transport system permease protein